MKKMYFVTAMAMAASLMASACSSTGTNTGTSTQSPSPASSTPASSAPTAKPKIALSWYVDSPANGNLPDKDKDFVIKAIQDKFNVELKIDYMPFGTDRTSKMNIIMASGDVPDMFLTNGTDSQKYAIDGLLADLTPFVSPKTMPNYYKWVTDDEVKDYQMLGLPYVRAPLPFQRTLFYSYYIRKDWLDTLKLQPPKDYKELMDVMRAFTNNDPDGNGKKDTYGFSASASGGRIPFDFPQYLENNLVSAFMIQDNKFVDTQSDPRMQAVIQGVLDMIKDGSVDPDWFSNKGTTHLDKAAQGKVGVVWGSGKTVALDGDSNSLQSKAKKINPKAEWIPINPFADRWVWKEGEATNAFLFSKKSADKDPEKIRRSVEILDWLTTEEGYLLTHYGLENKHYKKEGKKITLIPDAFENDVVKNGNFLMIYDFFTPDETTTLGLEIVDPRISDRDTKIVKEISAYKKMPNLGLSLSPPDGTNIGDFRNKMSEFHVKAIFDDKTADVWPKYRDELMKKYDGAKIFGSYVDQIRKDGKNVQDFK